MKISWSPQAKKEYEKILLYLNESWSIKEIENFIIKTETVLNGIQENPYMFVKSTKKKNVCKALINKQNSVFYHIKPLKKEIVLLSSGTIEKILRNRNINPTPKRKSGIPSSIVHNKTRQTNTALF